MARVEIEPIVLAATGLPIAGASVQVNLRASTAATVYADATSGSTLSNPVTTSSIGRIPGWLLPGSYDLVVTSGILTPRTIHYEAIGGTADGRILDLEAALGTDARFPTTAEKDALAGTVNAPSASNLFVTKDDRRIIAPVGKMLLYPSTLTTPVGWLPCSGVPYLVSAAPDLAALVGTLFGTLTNGSGVAGTTHFMAPIISSPVANARYIINAGLYPSELVVAAKPDANPVAFGNNSQLNGGAGVFRAISMRVNGTTAISYGAVTVIGTDATSFTITGTNTTANTTRYPGNTSTITVRFRGLGALGAKTAQVRVAVNNNSAIDPILINVSGNLGL